MPNSILTNENLITGITGTWGETQLHSIFDASIEDPIQMLEDQSIIISEIDENSLVTLWDKDEKGNQVQIPYKDAILLDQQIYGYVRKDDPRLRIDYITGKNILVDLKDLRFRPYPIYDSIDSRGLLFNTNELYTIVEHDVVNEGLISDTLNDDFVVIYNSNDERVYIKESLLVNKVFNKYYSDVIKVGTYMHINSMYYRKHIKTEENNKLNIKTLGLKFKLSQNKSFLKDQKKNNIPITYINTLGKKYTYGLEIETISGALPRYISRKLYCSAVFDGSLRHKDDNTAYGLEYVTDVLTGDNGLLELKKLTNILSKRCLINYQCGIHTHIGGADFTKENIVLMYDLYQRIQNEVYLMMPLSRRNNEYCSKLPKLSYQDKMDNIKQDYKLKINMYYDEIVKFLSKKDTAGKSVNKKKDHPAGFKCGYDHKSARYCWVNFVPSVFNTRKNNIYTIEFRPMSASMSYTKIKNWLLVCMALVDVVENHKQAILDGKVNTLFDILHLSYGNNAKPIIEYVASRIDKFSDEHTSQKEEIEEYSEIEINNDLSLKKL